MPLLLGVNIDHIATLRQARYARTPEAANAEPSPLQAAFDALAGGADSLTLHVRGDRRHMQDADAFRIRAEVPLPLNFEMGVTAEMIAIALKLQPDFACLVPESREEVTTEGGLDVAGRFAPTRSAVTQLQAAGIRVSLFIDPDVPQVEAAARTGARMIELHTGCFANAPAAAIQAEIDRLAAAARAGHAAGLQVNAGHGINYSNLLRLWAVPHLTELNIGHSIVARALRTGLTSAVREMKELMASYPRPAMTVHGIGIDVVEVARIGAAIERHGEAFLARLFTPAERDYCGSKKTPALHYAARFAAKEAVSKALGTGIGSHANWLDLEITHAAGGAPKLLLHGLAADFTNTHGITDIQISLTHAQAYAAATAIAITGLKTQDNKTQEAR